MKLLVLVFILNITAVAGQETGQVLYDDMNNPFPLTAPPQRVVSLAPNITEILFALGLGERIVGVTRYCDYPPQTEQKEKIGGIVDLNLEKINSLHPDLIIAFRGNPLRILNKLKRLHFPVFILNEGKSLDDLFLTVEKVGRLTHQEKQAEILVTALRKKSRAIEQALQSVVKTPKVFLSLPGEGLWTCGKESYLNGLLAEAKGVNLAGQIPRKWLQINREQLIFENPSVIIVMAKNREDFSRVKKRLLEDSRLKTIEALRQGQIFLLDEDIASRFGPRLVEAYAEIARLLHPMKFQETQ